MPWYEVSVERERVIYEGLTVTVEADDEDMAVVSALAKAHSNPDRRWSVIDDCEVREIYADDITPVTAPEEC